MALIFDTVFKAVNLTHAFVDAEGKELFDFSHFSLGWQKW